MVTVFKDIFNYFWIPKNYHKRAFDTFLIIKEHGELYDENQRPAIIKEKAKVMLKWLLEKKENEDCYHEAKELWKIANGLFSDAVGQEYEPDYLIKNRIKRLENQRTDESFNEAKRVWLTYNKICPDTITEEYRPITRH